MRTGFKLFQPIHIYKKIYLLCRISFQGPWERVNPWLSQGITIGSIQVHSQFQGPFRFIQDFRVHSGSIQDPFRIWGSRWDPFRVRAASPLPYHLPIGRYVSRFQTFSTYLYIYIYLLCRISFQGPWERVNPWLFQGITIAPHSPEDTYRVHSGSVQIPFGISGFIQVPFRFHSGFQVSFRFHSGFQVSFRFHFGSIQDFRVRSDSIGDPFRFI